MNKLTQSDIAKKLGVSLATVSRLRSQDRNPTLVLMAKIDRAFGWPIGRQAEAYKEGRWLEEFESVLQKASNEL